MNSNDNEKEGFNEFARSNEQANHSRQSKPEIFDIEKSDEEFFGASVPKQPEAAPSSPRPDAGKTGVPMGQHEFYERLAGNTPTPPQVQRETRENQRPQAVNRQPEAPTPPPIAPKRSVYKPNSFAELPPDVPAKPLRGSDRLSEPTIAIPKRAVGHPSGTDDADGVKIYGARGNENNASMYGSTAPVPRPSKPFKLNIKDEDYNAIPDFDNRAHKTRPTPPPLTAPPVQKRGKAAVQKAESEFDYVPPQAAAGAPPRPVNRTMRSLGRLANGIIYTVGVLLASILLSVFILQSMSDVLGLFKNDKEINVTIPKGADTKSVADILKENGIISQPLTFRLYTQYKYSENADVYLDGDFTLNSKMSYDEIMTAIRISKSEQQTVKLTFIEGMTAREIAKILEENHVCKADEFIQVLQTTDFGYEFEKLIPTGGNRYLKLEGYLFPDTYNFYLDEAPKSVADKFLKNFNKKITADLIDRIDKMGWTLDQAITLGSIVQKEGRTLDDMYAVSSVFNNRLNSNGKFPLLQSDVTINYVNDNITPFVSGTADQQAYASAYNTYKCEGLPVGPVGNPGVNAIKAAIYPDTSANYYFVTDEEMHYYFAQTLSQHEANMAKAKAVGDTVGGVDTHEEQ